jgi:RNA polymerase sigma-70 factor, ECF subfamily
MRHDDPLRRAGDHPRVTESEAMESTPAVSDELTRLVAAAKAGDRSAFDEVVRATYAGAYTLAYRLTGNEEDAKDVVQEAYLRAYKGLKRFRGDAAFSTWLYRITANCAATQLTSRARHRHDDLDDEAAVADTRPEIDPEAGADAAALRQRLNVALAGLPPRLRAVVVLRDVYDLPHEAIAEELGISEAAAKVRLHRARQRLRDHLFPGRGGIGEEDRRAM